MTRYAYCPQENVRLLQSKEKSARQGLLVDVSQLLESESSAFLSGVDKMAIVEQRSRCAWKCIDGDAYFARFHPGEPEMDILLGVNENGNPRILVADCKLEMKGGASLANRKYLPDVCVDLYKKYNSVRTHVDPIVPITRLYVIFNHAVASVARRYLSHCSHGTNHACQLCRCFRFECLTIADFNKLMRKAGE